MEECSYNNFLAEDFVDAIEHGILMSNLAYKVSAQLGMNEEFCMEMARAGMVHDIGKLKLSRYLYGRAEDTLQIEEMKYVRMHSKLSYEILQNYDYSDLVLQAVYHHHENYDGTGYPDNLKEDNIPFGARILRTCDVFAALISERPYRTAFDTNAAMEMLIEEVKNFDIRVFLAFQQIVNENDFYPIRLMELRNDLNNIIKSLDTDFNDLNY